MQWKISLTPSSRELARCPDELTKKLLIGKMQRDRLTWTVLSFPLSWVDDNKRTLIEQPVLLSTTPQFLKKLGLVWRLPRQLSKHFSPDSIGIPENCYGKAFKPKGWNVWPLDVFFRCLRCTLIKRSLWVFDTWSKAVAKTAPKTKLSSLSYFWKPWRLC